MLSTTFPRDSDSTYINQHHHIITPESQAQVPKLKQDILKIEDSLKRSYENAARGDYTLWATGPDVALDMIRVSQQPLLPSLGAW